jgi:hypothetical protein
MTTLPVIPGIPVQVKCLGSPNSLRGEWTYRFFSHTPIAMNNLVGPVVRSLLVECQKRIGARITYPLQEIWVNRVAIYKFAKDAQGNKILANNNGQNQYMANVLVDINGKCGMNVPPNTPCIENMNSQLIVEEVAMVVIQLDPGMNFIPSRGTTVTNAVVATNGPQGIVYSGAIPVPVPNSWQGSEGNMDEIPWPTYTAPASGMLPLPSTPFGAPPGTTIPAPPAPANTQYVPGPKIPPNAQLAVTPGTWTVSRPGLITVPPGGFISSIGPIPANVLAGPIQPSLLNGRGILSTPFGPLSVPLMNAVRRLPITTIVPQPTSSTVELMNRLPRSAIFGTPSTVTAINSIPFMAPAIMGTINTTRTFLQRGGLSRRPTSKFYGGAEKKDWSQVQMRSQTGGCEDGDCYTDDSEVDIESDMDSDPEDSETVQLRNNLREKLDAMKPSSEGKSKPELAPLSDEEGPSDFEDVGLDSLTEK